MPAASKDHGRYHAARPFLLRMTGFAVEEVAALRAASAVEAADRLAAEGAAAARAEDALLAELSHDAARDARRALKQGKPLPPDVAGRDTARALHAARRARDDAETQRDAAYADALATGRERLYEVARSERFRHVLLLSTPVLEAQTPAAGPAPKRNAQARRREATWLSYLQRLCIKNETVSFFGPTVWGRIRDDDPRACDIVLAEPAVAERRVYVERWTCEEVVARICADPEARGGWRLRPAEDLAFAEEPSVRLGGGEPLALDAEERACLRAFADGPRIHEVGDSTVVERLIERGLLLKTITREALLFSPAPLATLRAELVGWPAGAPAARWIGLLDQLASHAQRIEAATGLDERRAALEALARLLRDGGLEASRGQQTIYASRFAVTEDCRRAASAVVLGRGFTERLSDLDPWFEMWRDLVGLYAGAAYERLRPILAATGGRAAWPRFMKSCDDARLPLSQTGGLGIAPRLAAEIQTAWTAQLGERWRAREVILTTEDLSFVRRRWSPARMKAYDLPAPDVQIAAPDAAALARGEWQLVLSEIHPDSSPWANCFQMWCPDQAELAEDYARHPPAVLFGRSRSHDSVHMMMRAYGRMKGWTFVGDGASGEGVAGLRAADATVVLEDDDVVVRDPTGAVRGSLIHNWLIALNTHQLELLGDHAHTPRLRVGRCVAQRETWLVEPAETLRREVEAGGAVAFSALRSLQRELGLPDEVMIRPQLPIKGTLHKASKPMFADFRSPLLLELVVEGWRKYGAFRFWELLPSTDDCWLADGAGHYTCELRLAMREVR